MNSTEALTFTRNLKETPIKIDDEDYFLRELDGVQRDAYLNDMSKRMTAPGKGGERYVSNFLGLQASLLAQCLYDAEGKAVGRDTINRWPASTVSGLFKAAQELSKLEPEPTEPKNE